jgi:hypothetical protein
MPMPPPKPSTEVRDPHTDHEIAQLLRALHATGAQVPDDLAELVGARFWDVGRFERAVALAVADGVIARTADGRLSAI